VTGTITPTSTDTITPHADTATVTPTGTVILNAPAATATESDTLKIKNVILYPLPFNPDKQDKIFIRYTATKKFNKERLIVYTTGFRLVREIEYSMSYAAGSETTGFGSSYFRNMANGTYYYYMVISGTDGKEARTKIDKIIILR
jgi:hypothetical protein